MKENLSQVSLKSPKKMEPPALKIKKFSPSMSRQKECYVMCLKNFLQARGKNIILGNSICMVHRRLHVWHPSSVGRAVD